tara:strand:- start:29412 stop:29711 length:300 start_codon:yes stop_codon:yes gene_type:complete
MNNYIKTISLLEERVIKLVNRLKENYLSLNQLIEKIDILETSEKNLKIKLADIEKQNTTLIIANNMLGGSDGKTTTKRKINRLIKEVDACIFNLSEIQK